MTVNFTLIFKAASLSSVLKFAHITVHHTVLAYIYFLGPKVPSGPTKSVVTPEIPHIRSFGRVKKKIVMYTSPSIGLSDGGFTCCQNLRASIKILSYFVSLRHCRHSIQTGPFGYNGEEQIAPPVIITLIMPYDEPSMNINLTYS